MKILGVDPGIHGGLAIVELNDGAAPELVDVIDIPTIGVGAAERINPHAVQEWLLLHGPTTAIIERARSMPKQGVASTFKYGRATGSIETVIQLCSIPLKFVEPTKWKKVFQLAGKDKESARQLALMRFPTAHALLARKKDHQRAEAMLIALFAANNRDAP